MRVIRETSSQRVQQKTGENTLLQAIHLETNRCTFCAKRRKKPAKSVKQKAFDVGNNAPEYFEYDEKCLQRTRPVWRRHAPLRQQNFAVSWSRRVCFFRQKRGETNPRTGMGEKRGQGLVFEPGNLASGVARVTLTPKEGEGGIGVMYACINDTYACTYANYATGIFLLRTFIQHDVRTVNCVPY